MSGPGFSPELRQRQTQAAVLAPQLRQSLKILQVAALDLRSVIQEELQSNPVLDEESPSDNVSLEKEREAADAETNPGDKDDPDDEHREELDFSKEFEILGKLDQDWRDHLSNAGGNQPHTPEDAEKRQHFFDSLVSETSLQEHLMGQAELADLAPPVLEAMRHLVGSLDDRGFLTQTASDLALQARLPLDAMQEAIRILQTFEPAGIGAADIAGCLLLQLAAKGRDSSLAARVVRDHFSLLSRRRIPELARKTGATADDIQRAVAEIAALDPAPGRRFAEDSNRVVVPDASIERDGDGWKVTLNRDYIPRLRINPTYRDLIAKGTLSRPEGEYLRERIRSGKFLINSIAQRQHTIERITREILKAQTEFFEHGVSRLRPLTMTQIADVVGVHETTVSRAIANKYLKTPHGVFDFKYFFTPGYQAAGGGAAVSNTSVKEMIADLVAAEDRAHPLSDQEIVARLRDKGLTIARRTVAKYREELGLLPSNLRRDYA
jgi:RNA polymerase sigma-54 factor